MLVSYNWLKEYIDIKDISAKALADKLSVTGIEVEGIENLAEGLKKIVVGFVKECRPHPDSDHLNICQVEVAPGEVSQIVCGAPNVAAGQKVIVALPGARIADNVKIKKGKMRGEVSNGMICALQELGISENVVPKEYADGIYILPADAPIGEDVMPYLGLDDEIIELSITPNRADALSMHGVAYEVGAMYDKKPAFPAVEVSESSVALNDHLTAEVKEDSDVLGYYLKEVKNVVIKPSPLWMQMRLLKEGIRPINNVVDITNYVLLEYGQPLHAFDADEIKTGKIVVRKALENEKLVTLDGEERDLSTEDTVITNGEVPLALAGVMGGLDSEITEKTVNVVVESAVFAGKSIRLTAKRHNLRSESSARFEKGLNVGTVKEALDRAVSLMAQYASGEVSKGVVVGKEIDVPTVEVAVTLTKINRYLGTELSVADVLKIFAQLDFATTEKDEVFTVTVPSRRWDIAIPVDLIEEVARIYGYDNLPTTLPKGETTIGALTKDQRLIRQIRHLLNGIGLQEAISYALTTPEKAQEFALEESKLTSLMWPMSEERSVLRLNLISGLLDDIAFNVARKNQNLAFYEVGNVFYQMNDPKKDLPQERNHLSIALTGELPQGNWQKAGEAVDFFTLKGILEKLFHLLGIEDYSLNNQETLPSFHPGRSGVIYLGEEKVGAIGQIHPLTAKKYDIPETYVLELDLVTLFAHTGEISYIPVSKFPSISRDLALLVKEEVSHGELEKVIIENGGRFLKAVNLFDVYQGKGIAAGEKSLAYSLTFENPEATLTDDEINHSFEKITTALNEKLGAIIR